MAGFKKIKLSNGESTEALGRSFLPRLSGSLFMPSKRTKAAHVDKVDLPERRINRKKLASRLTVLLVLILVSLLIYIVRNNFFSVKRIEVKNVLSCVDVMKLSREPRILGKNILLLNADDLERSIKSKLACAETLKINKKFPDLVTIEMTGKVPILAFNLVKRPPQLSIDLDDATASSQAAIKQDFGIDKLDVQGLYFVDKTGVLYQETQMDQIGNLQVIYFLTDDIESGKYIPQSELDTFLVLSEKLKSLEVAVNSLKIDGQKLIVDGEPKVVLALDKDPLRQAASLQLILQKAKMNLSSVDMVDLRFDKPVVVYYSKK